MWKGCCNFYKELGRSLVVASLSKLQLLIAAFKELSRTTLRCSISEAYITKHAIYNNFTVQPQHITITNYRNYTKQPIGTLASLCSTYILVVWVKEGSWCTFFKMKKRKEKGRESEMCPCMQTTAHWKAVPSWQRLLWTGTLPCSLQREFQEKGFESGGLLE